MKENSILNPARDTLERLIATQRQKARQFIYDKMLTHITKEQCCQLNSLIHFNEDHLSPLQQLKQPPAQSSPKALIALTKKLALIDVIGIATVDTSWLNNNNYQRTLSKYVLRCSAKRLRSLQEAYRYTALICFLKQLYQETIDHIIDMHHKLMLKIYNRADAQLNEATKKQRKHFKQSQIFLNKITNFILDDTIEDYQLREAIFNQIKRESLEQHLLDSRVWLTGKFSHIFPLVTERFSYLRQFAPALIAHLTFEAKGERASHLCKRSTKYI